MKLFSRVDPGWLIAALLPLIGILPTLGEGIARTADGPLHVHRTYAMATLLEQGILWPRWVPWFHLGYGYPIFNFYPPGVFYLGGVLGLAGVPIPLAFNLVAALAWILGSTGMYGLARTFLPGTGALLAALLWVYAPSRLFEVWDQGSLPQMMAAACFPWALWGLVRAARNATPGNALSVALPFAGMILCHQPITIIGGLFIAPASLMLPLAASWPDRRAFFRRLICSWSGLLLGTGLAAIFLLPVVLELRYVKANQQAEDVIPYLISNFLQPHELFMQPAPVDLTDLRLELPTTLGLAGGVLGVLGLGALIWRKQYKVAAGLILALAFALFMMLEVSLPVWQTIPFMAQLRFPERFLRVAAVFLALAGGASLLLLPKRWRTAAMGAGMALALLAAMPLVYPNQPFVNWPNLSPLDEIDMEKTERIWGSTSYDEFDPIWGSKPGWDTAMAYEEYLSDPMRIIANQGDQIQQWPELRVQQADSTAFRISVASERPVRFRQFYFPGWTATLNGRPAAIYPDWEYGEITVDVPAGSHLVRLTYVGTAAQHVGAGITLASLAAAVIVLGKSITQRRREAEAQREEAQKLLNWRTAGVVSGGIIGFALVNTLVLTPSTLWFRHQSPPDNPVYMQTAVHQSFGGVFELLGYTLEQEQVESGGLLSVTLFWRAQGALDREYRPVAQLVNLTGTAAWGVSEPFFPGGGSTANGYPPDRFASDVHELRIFQDAPPYVGRIRVQMVDAASGEPLKLPDGSNHLILPPLIRITGGGQALPDRLQVRFEDTVELRCATVKAQNEQLTVTTGWQVLATPEQDFRVFVHALDAEGGIVEQYDGLPLGEDYPPTLWQPGQNLSASFSLPMNPAIERIGLGLYTDAGRLAAVQAGQAVPDNYLLLPLTEQSCQP